ncbi:MAG: Concanavalin A-like lectin/glucanase superfamily [Chthoniobacter sp.]|jgi:hypothetical protein|nr:Concanavalin A-like lectin/glucanase superfamily [Chthoniobacter sp.]
MRLPARCLAAVASFLLSGGAVIVQPAQAGIAAVRPPAAGRNLDALGPLKADLELWLSMDSIKQGGVAWSRGPVKLVASSEVEVQDEEGQRWLDFNEPGAVLKFEPALQIGTRYTLSSWMLVPAPRRHALLWQGVKDSGCPLFVSDTGLYGWNAVRHEQVTFAHLPKGFTGWHHFAVTCDGETTTAFLDGRKVGSVPEVLATNILSIGNHWMRAHQHWMMCDGLDDQFIFRRPLTEEEVRTVMKLGRQQARK